MTEFEAVEVVHMYNELVVVASMHFVAILFAYTVAAHLAGENLPPRIAIGVTVIYSLFECTHFIGTYANLGVTYDAIQYIVETYPESAVASEAAVPFYLLVSLFCVPMFLGWVGSIYYMHFYIRDANREGI